VRLKPYLCFCQFSEFKAVFDAIEAGIDLMQHRVEIVDVALVRMQQQPYGIRLVTQIPDGGVCFIGSLMKAA